MNKFQKLAQLNKDIELLENAGKIKAADILHQKFIREAQYMMPQMMMPQMMMPQMMMPQMMPMMPQMLARPTIAPTALAKPVVTPAPMPVAQPRTTPVQTIGTPNPGVDPVPSPAPKPVPSPGNMQTAPMPPTTNPYDNYYKDPRTGKIIFVDPDDGKDLPSESGGYNVTPPGNYGDGKGGIVSVPPPGTTPPSGDKSFVGKDVMDDPRVKEFMKKFMGNDFLSGKQKQDMLDQFLRSIGLK